MTPLSLTALRFIGLALAQHGNQQQQAEWRTWASKPARDLAPHLAQIALHALSGMALSFEDRIADAATSSSEAAQLENDLGYISVVEAILLEHINQPIRAYG